MTKGLVLGLLWAGIALGAAIYGASDVMIGTALICSAIWGAAR